MNNGIRNVKKTIPFSIAPIKMTYLSINLTNIHKLHIYIHAYIYTKRENYDKNLKLFKQLDWL